MARRCEAASIGGATAWWVDSTISSNADAQSIWDAGRVSRLAPRTATCRSAGAKTQFHGCFAWWDLRSLSEAVVGA